MCDELATYRVYYDDPDVDMIGNPPFTEVKATSEERALSQAQQSDNKDFTHAEFWDDL